MAAEDPLALNHPNINDWWRWEYLSAIYQWTFFSVAQWVVKMVKIHQHLPSVSYIMGKKAGFKKLKILGFHLNPKMENDEKRH